MKITKGTLVFRIIYFTLLILSISAIGIGLLFFRDFLTDYEASQPEKIIDSFLWELESGNDSRIFAAIEFSPNAFENDDIFKAEVKKTLAGDYSCAKRSKESTKSKLVYTIKSADSKIGSVVLSETANKSKYDFPIYEISGITINDVEVHDITIHAPSTAVVSVNGITLSETYIEKKGGAVKGMEFFHQYLSAEDTPYMVTYKISGFAAAPTVSAVDYAGRELSDLGNYTYSFASVSDSELKSRAEEFCLAYSRYIANDGYLRTVAEYLADNLELYDTLYYYENEFYAWHTDYEFENISVDDPVFYTDSCFSIRVTYDHIIHSTEVFTFPADNTVYFVKTDDVWKVTDIVMN